MFTFRPDILPLSENLQYEYSMGPLKAQAIFKWSREAQTILSEVDVTMFGQKMASYLCESKGFEKNVYQETDRLRGRTKTWARNNQVIKHTVSLNKEIENYEYLADENILNPLEAMYSVRVLPGETMRADEFSVYGKIKLQKIKLNLVGEEAHLVPAEETPSNDLKKILSDGFKLVFDTSTGRVQSVIIELRGFPFFKVQLKSVTF